MDIHVQSPDKRAIAQVLGRYFESRSLRYHIEELPGGVLQIGFRASGRPVAVTVSFDDAAYDTYTHWDASQKQLALGRLADGFADDVDAQPGRAGRRLSRRAILIPLRFTGLSRVRQCPHAAGALRPRVVA